MSSFFPWNLALGKMLTSPSHKQTRSVLHNTFPVCGYHPRFLHRSFPHDPESLQPTAQSSTDLFLEEVGLTGFPWGSLNSFDCPAMDQKALVLLTPLLEGRGPQRWGPGLPPEPGSPTLDGGPLLPIVLAEATTVRQLWPQESFCPYGANRPGRPASTLS